MGEVACVVSGPLNMRGQPGTAALRERSCRDPALGDEGQQSCQPPTQLGGPCYPRIGCAHSF